MNYIFDTGFSRISYSFIFDQTYKYFEKYIQQSGTDDTDLSVSIQELVNNPYKFKYYGLDPYSEFQTLMVKTGNYLLSYDACMFHGALVQWNDSAILFSAPSGTGKTTQYRLWREMERSIKMINGDKPILQYDGTNIIGRSSPWNGKEQYGAAGMSAKLKAVILLEQGDSNTIESLNPSDAVVPLFTQFIAYPENTDILQMEAAFLDKLLDTVPVWKLVNKGDIDSAILTSDTLEAYYGL